MTATRNGNGNNGKPMVPRTNAEGERALLGGMLLDNRRIPDVLSIVPRRAIEEALHPPAASRRPDPNPAPTLFSTPANQLIFDTIVRLHFAGSGVDLTTLGAALDNVGRYDAVGGAPYLASLEEEIVSTFYLPDYARIVVEKWRWRSLDHTVGRAFRETSDPNANVTATEAAERIAAETMALVESGDSGRRPIAVADYASQWLADLEAGRAGGKPRGLPIPIPYLQRPTGGFKPGNLAIVAARPSVGKSALAIQWAWFVCNMERANGIFASYEMSRKEVFDRIVSMRSTVPYKLLGDPAQLSREDAFKAQLASEHISENICLTVDDTQPSIEQFCAATRAAAKRGRVDFVVLDYLQLVPVSKRTDRREEEVSTVTRLLKNLALDLQIPVVALSQFNRESDKANRPPKLSDLRESGAIEQDADVCVFLHRTKAEDNTGVQIQVAKCRGGEITPWSPVGRIRFLPHVNLFAESN